MKIIRAVNEMTAWAKSVRRSGKSLALVPTMGFFHEGHLRLMRLASQRADFVVVSLFVNPIQFGPQEDLSRYPRDFDRDAQLAQNEKIDVLFVPSVDEMYPADHQTEVQVRHLTAGLCGKSRPGHFNGVTTVVAKLFNIVLPHCAVFGEKDCQQLVVIRRMVRDLNYDIKIVAHPIVRDRDGLAMSSRNSYLSQAECQSALCLCRALQLARERVAAGVLDARQLIELVASHLSSYDHVTTEYISLVDQESLNEKDTVDEGSVLALAIRVGDTRLIDNGRLYEKM